MYKRIYLLFRTIIRIILILRISEWKIIKHVKEKDKEIGRLDDKIGGFVMNSTKKGMYQSINGQ